MARLVESDPRNAALARQDASPFAGVEVLEADAGCTDAYAGAVPADIVLACGVFGNISDGDIHRTVAAFPSLCAPGGVVTWTRHREEPDLTPRVRQWFPVSRLHRGGLRQPGGHAHGGRLAPALRGARPFEAGQYLFRFIGRQAGAELTARIYVAKHLP